MSRRNVARPGARQFDLDDRQKRRVERMFRDGYQQHEVAASLGVGATALTNACARAGIALPASPHSRRSAVAGGQPKRQTKKGTP